MAKKQIIGVSIYSAIQRLAESKAAHSRLIATANPADPAWQPEVDRGDDAATVLQERLDAYRYLHSVETEAAEAVVKAAAVLAEAEAAAAAVRAASIQPLVEAQTNAHDDLVDRLTSTALLGRDPNGEDAAFALFRDTVCHLSRLRAAATPDLHKHEQVVEAAQGALVKTQAELTAVRQRAEEAYKVFMAELTTVAHTRVQTAERVLAAFGLKEKRREMLVTAFHAGLLVGSDSLPAAPAEAPEAEAAPAEAEAAETEPATGEG